MNILLFGKNGQVGWKSQRALAPLGSVHAFGKEQAPRATGDLKNLEGITETVRMIKPDIIVNAAAYTAVDQAETDVDLARRINAVAPEVLAREAKELGALLVHYSTDYVFDGTGDKPWREEDPTNPLSVYGKTKLEGEQAIQASTCNYLIFRTSWVYAARGSNFAKTILRLGRERTTLSVIDDQTGAPTGADLIADVTAHAIRAAYRQPSLSGLYHLVAKGHVTWHGYAKLVLQMARAAGLDVKVSEENILPIPMSSYPTAANRPANSRLATTRLTDTFNMRLPPWEAGVERMLSEVLEK